MAHETQPPSTPCYWLNGWITEPFLIFSVETLILHVMTELQNWGFEPVADLLPWPSSSTYPHGHRSWLSQLAGTPHIKQLQLKSTKCVKLNCRKFVLFFFRWGCHYQTKHHVSQAHSLGEREMAWDKAIFTQGEQIRTAHELHHWQSNMFSCLPLCDFPAITCEFEAMTTGDIQRMYCISWSATGHSSVSFIAFNHSTTTYNHERNDHTARAVRFRIAKFHFSEVNVVAQGPSEYKQKLCSYATSQVINIRCCGAEAEIIWALRSVHDPANNCR